VAFRVGGLRATLGKGDELIAHVDERHARHPPPQLELKQRAVEGERLVDVADFQRDVVEADRPSLLGSQGLAPARLGDRD
jgi:hypothetical protein